MQRTQSPSVLPSPLAVGAPTFLSSFWTVLPVFPDGVREEPPFRWCSLEWHQLPAVTIRHSSASSLRHPKTETWYIQVNGFLLRWLYYCFLRKCETVPWVRKGAKEVWGSNTDERHFLCPPPRSRSQGPTPLAWTCRQGYPPWLWSSTRRQEHVGAQVLAASLPRCLQLQG